MRQRGNEMSARHAQCAREAPYNAYDSIAPHHTAADAPIPSKRTMPVAGRAGDVSPVPVGASGGAEARARALRPRAPERRGAQRHCARSGGKPVLLETPVTWVGFSPNPSHAKPSQPKPSQ